MQQKKIPLRKCNGCGEMKPKSELVRIVLTPNGEIVLDKKGKAQGRGAYICNDIKCLQRVIKSCRIDTVFDRQVPESIYSALLEEFSHE